MYADLDALRARHDRPEHPELTELTAGAGADAPDLDRLRRALAAASGQMDLYLGVRHRLPLAGLSDTEREELARIACDIARYRLWPDDAPETVRVRYAEAIGVLEQAAAGRLRLGRGAPAPRLGARLDSAPRRLTRRALDGLC
ncbi:DUF1320 domain-containing protein [Marichromatium gracile]|uniref:DUF1320 domain-containing protein n=1 Tax=Marichromatium gracile TaxID=1048 RepID=UPI001F2506D4|nr:DUF1320 domain-containing protein [Marichromatium gracile]MCF1184046.1 DUF1320 domain-containing protein [Marichromatium gracile]